jgi:hypothetical protein
MSGSYKPVMLLAILDHFDDRGRAAIDAVVSAFHAYYLDRLRRGVPVERAGMRMTQADRLSHEDVRSLMLGMPFRKFEQRKYLAYDRQDLAYLRFPSNLWRQLTDEDKATLRGHCERAIADYYERLKPRFLPVLCDAGRSDRGSPRARLRRARRLSGLAGPHAGHRSAARPRRLRSDGGRDR